VATYILTWNPERWAFEDWPQALTDLREQGFYVRQWSCVSSSVVPGDTMLLKKAGRGLRGIFASGVALSAPYENRHWGAGKGGFTKRYVQVRFERLADYTKGEILQIDDRRDLGFVPQASGCLIREDRAAALLRRFHQYVAAPVPVQRVRVAPAGGRRMAISASVRYSILERDAFTCRYCGKSPPEVVLHVDHVISQLDWRQRFGNLDAAQAIDGTTLNGVNDPANLAASCAQCNLGKGRRSVGAI
jgi:5-methylcytosine-specific restriction endonuclease McrA